MFNRETILENFGASPEMLVEVSLNQIKDALGSFVNVDPFFFDPFLSSGVRVELKKDEDGELFVAPNPADMTRIAQQELVESHLQKDKIFKLLMPLVQNKTRWKSPVIVLCPVSHSAMVGETLSYFHASEVEILPFEENSSLCFVCSEGYCAD